MNDAKFPHRQNPDGTWDSICPQCFVNSASAACEDDLVELEKRHVCGHYSRPERNEAKRSRAA